ncbi:heterokaryon incompatibility protein-domain-containing protein [Paraphoma chrysanthemicola]|nr:heterokaryon incompatibility protein-domain-containing protein [Paraphoma chrysanthemicola]
MYSPLQLRCAFVVGKASTIISMPFFSNTAIYRLSHKCNGAARVFQRAWRFAKLPFGVDRFFPSLPQGWSVSFGFWIRFCVDEPYVPPSIPNEQGYGGHYRELDHSKNEVRLIVLEPGQPSNRIVFSAIHVQLSEETDYEALSYCWGSSDDSMSCIWDGVELRIPPNLHSGLQQLRLPDRPRRLWVDALSIDQSNLHERSHQVQMMSNIYRYATSVLIWLGVEDEAGTAVDGMEGLRFFVNPGAEPTSAPWYNDTPERTSKGMRYVLGAQWWKRIWTVQEAALARDVQLFCGPHTVRWKTDIDTLRRIKFIIKFAATSPQWEKSIFHDVNLNPLIEVIEMQMREREEETGVRYEKDILDVRYDLRHRQSVDPRDKLFAFLSLAESRRMDWGGIVNYNHTSERVHANFARILQQLYPGGDVPLEWGQGFL